MRYTTIITRLFVLTVLLSSNALFVSAQTERLTLAEILTGLQSQSSGVSLATKNNFIMQRVRQRGVTFTLSDEIRNELLRAGASVGLMSAIRTAAPKNVVAKKGSASNIEFDRLWVSYDVTENNKKGMRVHAKFTIRQMLDVPLQMTVRFQKDNGDTLMAKQGSRLRNKAGQLAVFRNLKPAYENAVYKDYSVFLPYSELNLGRGVHKLKVDADIIYPDGTFLKHLKLHPFQFRRGVAPTTKAAALNRMWIEHQVRVNGKLGMRINADVNVSNMIGQELNMAFKIERQSGTPVKGLTSRYRSKSGNLTGYRSMAKPTLAVSRYRTVSSFIPYSEFAQVGPTRNFKVHADVFYNNYRNELHVGYKEFTLPARNSAAVPRVKLNSLNIVHNQVVGGQRGMFVVVDFNVSNKKDQPIQLAVKVMRQSGGIIRGRSAAYRTPGTGQLVSSIELNPLFDPARFRNQRVFIPYSEFSVARGSQRLRLHVDILYGETGNAHLTYRNFVRRF